MRPHLFRTVLRRAAFACAVVAGWSLPGAATAQVTFDVSFIDPGNLHSASYAALTSHVQASGVRWAGYFQNAATVAVQVQIEFTTDVPRATGRSETSVFVNTVNGFNVFEQSTAHKLRTGTDFNGATPDVLIQLNPGYLNNELWLDPNPAARTAPVPGNRTDAMSVFIHELGHALAFNGWRDGTTGALPGNYMSTWDRHVTFDGTNLFFNGPAAVDEYGGPVAVTFNNPNHIGNSAQSGRPGSDLIPDLMNGVVFFRGQRYDVSALDLAISSDAGIPLAPVPEPAGLLGLGLVLAVAAAGRRVSLAMSAK
jgi:hypothetical protein